jgi:hypothetical protein
MPAPSQDSLENFLKNALLAEGFVKKTYVNGILVTDPTQLPDSMKGMVKGLAVGLSLQWKVWQSTQVVTSAVTTAPGTALGSLTP